MVRCIRDAWEVFGSLWQNKQLTETRDLYHRGRKLVSCFSESEDRKGYVWIFLSSSLFMCSYISAIQLHFL